MNNIIKINKNTTIKIKLDEIIIKQYNEFVDAYNTIIISKQELQKICNKINEETQ